MPAPVLGIDLGTTNCVVASMDRGRMTLLTDDMGQSLFPSVVTIGENDRIWTCREAVALGAAVPGRTAYAVKRLLGRWYDDEVVQRARNIYAYEIAKEPEGGGVLIKLGRHEYKPEQIAAQILKELRRQFERRFGTNPTEAVVTVPAYFNHTQREGTQRAAAEAGLEVLRLLNEPTAAALSLPESGTDEQIVAVYDFGGGTFDISIIRIQGRVYEVLATDGDTFLGGDDIDGLLCDELSREFYQATQVRLRNFPLSWYRLRDAAEKAKMELSHADHCSIYLPRLVGEESLVTEINRQRLETLARPLIERSLSICAQTLDAAGLTPVKLDQLVLVGGPTRMPMLRHMVQDFFQRSASPGVNPDTAVAEGAAREGAMLRQGSGALLLDVTPITLGINIAGNRLYPLIPRNTKIPVRKEHMFTTHRDAQTQARMVILQGDNPVASENTRLGEVILRNLRGYERFHSRIQVAFEIDANGILHVKAMDKDTGEERNCVIQDSFSPEGREVAGELPESESLAPAEERVGPTIAGPFRATELVDVLFFLHANRKTGRIELSSDGMSGTLWMIDGQITHAQTDYSKGLDAAGQLLDIGEGNYSFYESEHLGEPAEIDTPFEILVGHN
ncbi:MAG: Hsp70 family protein [Deltaproteobacteria bacterium]|nr:Hsp70 family protein [Deltaproteobacteria bacterium]